MGLKAFYDHDFDKYNLKNKVKTNEFLDHGGFGTGTLNG